jgi:hypothetical protein
VTFARVDVAAGQTTTVHVSFPVAVLAVTPGGIDATARPQVQPGGHQLQVGTMSAPFTVR